MNCPTGIDTQKEVKDYGSATRAETSWVASLDPDTRVAEFDADVLRAAAYLDSAPGIPADWRDRINFETLELTCPCKCIVGQSLGMVWGVEWTAEQNRAWDDAHDWARLTWGNSFGPFIDGEAAWIDYLTATRAQASMDSTHDSGEPVTATSKPCEVRHRLTPSNALSVMGGQR